MAFKKTVERIAELEKDKVETLSELTLQTLGEVTGAIRTMGFVNAQAHANLKHAKDILADILSEFHPSQSK